jgi:hypothetical protein
LERPHLSVHGIHSTGHRPPDGKPSIRDAFAGPSPLLRPRFQPPSFDDATVITGRHRSTADRRPPTADRRPPTDWAGALRWTRVGRPRYDARVIKDRGLFERASVISGDWAHEYGRRTARTHGRPAGLAANGARPGPRGGGPGNGGPRDATTCCAGNQIAAR